MTDNLHEARARTRKVRRLCKAARDIAAAMRPPTSPAEFGELLDFASDKEWAHLSRYAGTVFPSYDTQARVIRALRRYDQERRG